MILALRWVITDQQRRCPVCLRLLTNPVRIGTPSRTFLEWYGAESTCSRGHGLLHVSEISSSYSEKPQWLRLGDSWSGLFSGAAIMTLELRNVSKAFTGILAVDDVSFQARAGEITGYLGPNGSGKSTTMKMITGLLQTTSGKILFDGESIESDLMAYKQRMGYVPEEPHLYGHLSGLEYLVMVGQLRNLPADGYGRSHRRPAAVVLPARGSACADLGLLEGDAAEGAAFARRFCTIRICYCWTNRFPGSTSARGWCCGA